MPSSPLSFGPRDDRKALEEGLTFSPKFDEKGLITAVATDAESGTVLMVAYMNDESLRKTLELGEAVYFSRSRNELWHKGATSGHTQKIREILVDCDQDALVLRVDQAGSGCCHVGYQTCFFRSVPLAADQPPGPVAILKQSIQDKSYDPNSVYKK